MEQVVQDHISPQHLLTVPVEVCVSDEAISKKPARSKLSQILGPIVRPFFTYVKTESGRFADENTSCKMTISTKK